jgi:hypothetical protein
VAVRSDMDIKLMQGELISLKSVQLPAQPARAHRLLPFALESLLSTTARCIGGTREVCRCWGTMHGIGPLDAM